MEQVVLQLFVDFLNPGASLKIEPAIYILIKSASWSSSDQTASILE